MMKTMNIFLAGFAAALAPTAHAAPYYFTITGPQAVTFSLDSSPIPTSVSNNEYFRTDGINSLLDGHASTLDIGFSSSTYYLGADLLISPSVGKLFITTGMQLYTGTETAPTFKIGTFKLGGFKIGSFSSPSGYNITIASSAVPEPATWAMMLAGFGMVGLAMRRHRNVRVAYA